MLEKPESNEREKGLKAKFQIGSIHGTLNYSHQSKAFHSHDVPDKARIKKNEVRELKNRNILGLTKPDWNQSVFVGELPVIRRSRQNSKCDPLQYSQHNFRSECLPRREVAYIPKVNKFRIDPVILDRNEEHRRLARSQTLVKTGSEAPINPKLENKINWNAATSIKMNDKEWKSREKELQEASLRNYKHKVKTLTTYKNVIERYKEDIETMRASTSLGDHIITSKNRNNNNDYEEGGVKFRPSTVSTRPSTVYSTVLPSNSNLPHLRRAPVVDRRYKTYHHSGKYEISPIEKRNAWSCCLAEGYNSQGCAFVIVDPDAPNFASIN